MKRFPIVFLLVLFTACSSKPKIAERSGESVIAGTFRWDISKDLNGPNGDLFLRHASETERYLEPGPGAAIAMTPGEEFGRVSLPDIQKAPFGTARITDTDDAPTFNRGAVILVRTAENKYAKIEISGWRPYHDLTFRGAENIEAKTKEWILSQPDREKYSLSVRWTIYENAP